MLFILVNLILIQKFFKSKLSIRIIQRTRRCGVRKGKWLNKSKFVLINSFFATDIQTCDTPAITFVKSRRIRLKEFCKTAILIINVLNGEIANIKNIIATWAWEGTS